MFSFLAVLCLLMGIIIPLIFDTLEIAGIRESVVIDGKDAASYDIWQSNFYGHGDKPVVNYDVYIFDLQNPDDTLNGSKPIVVERGPYAFRSYYNKFDISWSKSGDTVTYSSQKFYVFNPDRTAPGLRLDDEITIPYATAISFETLLSSIPADKQQMLDGVVEGKLNTLVIGIEMQIDAKEAEINNSTMTQEEKDAALTQLEELRGLLLVVQDVRFHPTPSLSTTPCDIN
jgi:hypothetical protein